MKTIKIKHPHQHFDDIPPSALALGFFDGVHKGHKEVILTAKHAAESARLKSGVMTFFPHPKEVLRKGERVKYLTSWIKKEELIAQLGVDYLIVIQFDELFSELTPQQFVDQYLIGLNVRHVVAGFDYTYGRLGKGTMETLPFHSRNALTSSVVEKVHHEGEKISSTNIRAALKQGNIQKVNDYLGWCYETSGMVVEGEKRGRTIGFPTANVQPDERIIVPDPGVFIVRIFVNNHWHRGICNVGYKPTFHDRKKEQTVEVHIFDFEDIIYGKEVTIQWLEKIRDEKKFASVQQLIDQLNDDVKTAAVFFSQQENVTSFCNKT
ncbi:riboflavin kinase / FMN adenylyltransferase [Evansella caseinilytica]|uniref:Riboflavin biosynthesis protein n=1 Tax=Evansella caseinilytica TaxID=1503961 RepID=A0A1H3M0X3_9BACI|nr:riboflavin biosynthesis protein RibF [Evansella caseinilytica]SDY70361.1 riboflavin kinase / FMN adenylyltransferase [Evansella caseinilytica]